MQANMGEAECLTSARLQWLRQESGDGVRTLPLSDRTHVDWYGSK